MFHYDSDAGGNIFLPRGKHLVDLGTDSPSLRLVADEVWLHVGPRASLVLGDRWSIVLDLHLPLGQAPRVLNKGQLVDLPVPPPGSGFVVMVLATTESPAAVHNNGAQVFIETAGELRLEILAEGDPELIQAPTARAKPPRT